MKLRIERVGRVPRWPVWSVVLVVAWVSAVAALHAFSGRMGWSGTVCNFKRVSGVPCPTCGSTRAGLAVLRGDVVGAWRYNPLVMAVGTALVALLVMRLAFARRVRLTLNLRDKLALVAVGTVVVLANWAYVILWVG